VNLSLSLSSITFLKSLFVFSFLLFSFASFSREKTNIETERRFLTSSSLSLIHSSLSLSRSLRICSRWWEYECAPLLPIFKRRRRERRERRIKRSALRRERGSFLSVCHFRLEFWEYYSLATKAYFNCCSNVIDWFFCGRKYLLLCCVSSLVVSRIQQQQWIIFFL
jgi:hypothetical protein